MPVQQIQGTPGADALHVVAGSGDIVVQGGGGADVLTVDWSFKTGPVTSYSAFGYHSFGPAWLNAGDGDRISYGATVSSTAYAQLNHLVLYSGSGNDILWGGAVTNEIHGGPGDDHIYGLTGSDTLYGDAGDDVLVGDGGLPFGGGDDRLFGGAGNDTLVGGPGNDSLDGGTGIDTAVYAGAHDGYAISFNGRTGVTTVRDLSGSEGTDSLVSIERLKFADGTFDLVRGRLFSEDGVRAGVPEDGQGRDADAHAAHQAASEFTAIWSWEAVHPPLSHLLWV